MIFLQLQNKTYDLCPDVGLYQKINWKDYFSSSQQRFAENIASFYMTNPF